MNTEKQLTVVEWLVEMVFNEEDLQDFVLVNVINQAKAMEKEQIKDAFVQCWKANIPDGVECKLDAEQYYNETFKSE